MLCLMHPSTQLPLLGCQGTLLTPVQFALTQTPRSLSTGLLSSLLSPSVYVKPGLPRLRWRIQRLLLLNFMQLAIAQLSSQSRSLCKAFLPSRESTAPSSLVSSANLFNVHSIPASRSFTKPYSGEQHLCSTCVAHPCFHCP